jgi:hypothetical protein
MFGFIIPARDTIFAYSIRCHFCVTAESILRHPNAGINRFRLQANFKHSVKTVKHFPFISV